MWFFNTFLIQTNTLYPIFSLANKILLTHNGTELCPVNFFPFMCRNKYAYEPYERKQFVII